MRKSSLRLLTFARRSSEGIFLTIFLGLVLRAFVLTNLFVPNSVMAPNLLPGDYILSYKLPFGVRLPFLGNIGRKRPPKRGDLLVFLCQQNGDKLCVRRVIGLPGDRVEMRGGRVILNGELAQYRKIEESEFGVVVEEANSFSSHRIVISKDEKRSRYGPVIVPPGQFFALSDHRALGDDSRDFGSVKFSQIEAEVVLIWLSKVWLKESNARFLGVRWERVFQSLD